MDSRKCSARFLCITAMMAALVCVTTMVIQIPIPLGYAHLGNAFILLAVMFVGKRTGVWAGGIGSALADLLTGYAYWALPTFVIKSVMALIVGRLAYTKEGSCTLFSIRSAVGCVLSMIWMVVGYTVSGAVLYGGIAAGLASAPGLAAEGILNLAVYYGVGTLFEKAKIRPLIAADRKQEHHV